MNLDSSAGVLDTAGGADLSVYGTHNRILGGHGDGEAYLCFGKSGAKIRHSRTSHLILREVDVPEFMRVLQVVLNAPAPNPPGHRNNGSVEIDGLIYLVARDVCWGHWSLSIRVAGPAGKTFAIFGFTDTEVIEMLNSWGSSSEEIHCERFFGFAHAWSLPYEIIPAPQHRELALEALDMIADALYGHMDQIKYLRICTVRGTLKISLDLAIDPADPQLPGVGGRTLLTRLKKIEKRSVRVLPVVEE